MRFLNSTTLILLGAALIVADISPKTSLRLRAIKADVDKAETELHLMGGIGNGT